MDDVFGLWKNPSRIAGADALEFTGHVWQAAGKQYEENFFLHYDSSLLILENCGTNAKNASLHDHSVCPKEMPEN